MTSQTEPSRSRTWTPAPASTLRRLVRGTLSADRRNRIHQFLMDTPVVSEAFHALNHSQDVNRVGDHTALVIDGVARSGNSYARAAFLHANGAPEAVCTHAHSHRAVSRGVARGLPVIVLVREPGAVLASALQFEAGTSATLVLDAYLRYYEHIAPLTDRVVIARFETVVSDFGSVIAECNRRFGTRFVEYERTPDAEAAVVEHIDIATRTLVGPDRFDAIVPRPNAARRPQADVLSTLTPTDLARLERARTLHRSLTAFAH